MLRKYSNSRSFRDNLRLGSFTAFIAGMVNVASLVLFYSFTSNLTGHFAILAQEISNGKWFQMLIVLFWILLFFSSRIIVRNKTIHFTVCKRLTACELPR